MFQVFASRDLFRGPSRRIFLGTLLVTALAKGAAFLPAYSIDDYFLVLQRPASAPMFRQGRFGQALLSQLLYLLQLEPPYSTLFFVAFGILASALLGTLIVRFWGFDRPGWMPVAAASFAANHPFTAEIFTFRTALASSMVAIALLSLLLVPRRWSLPLLGAGSVLFVFLLSIYQVVLHYCLMIVAMGAAFWLARYLKIGAAHGWPARVTSLLSARRILRHRNTALLICASAGTAAYAALALVLFRALDLARLERSRLIPLDMLDERGELILQVLRFRLLQTSPLLTVFTKGMLLLVLGAALAGLLWRARPWSRPRAAALLAAAYALVAAALVWSLGVIMVLQEFWPAPRVLSHMGIFWAGLLAIACLCLGPRLRMALAALSVLIVLSFIGASNRILHDQVRLNERDGLKASRIIGRLEAQPGFAENVPVAVIGRARGYYSLVYPTTDHDMNISALAPYWSVLWVLREISGYDLQPVPDEARRNAATAYCRGVQPWPGPESVIIRDGVAIVCLGPLE